MAKIAQATIPTPKAGVKPWMGKRNPVKLVSAVVMRKSAVVAGNLFEANIPPTTISPLPIATRVIMTCEIVKAPTDIPRIMAITRCLCARSQSFDFETGHRSIGLTFSTAQLVRNSRYQQLAERIERTDRRQLEGHQMGFAEWQLLQHGVRCLSVGHIQ